MKNGVRRGREGIQQEETEETEETEKAGCWGLNLGFGTAAFPSKWLNQGDRHAVALLLLLL